MDNQPNFDPTAGSRHHNDAPAVDYRGFTPDETSSPIFNEAVEAKRIEVRAKLDQLQQEVLDAIFEEEKFLNTPENKSIMAIINKDDDPEQMTDGDVKDMFDMLRSSAEGIAPFIMKAMTLPTRRAQAVKAYYEYRSMVELTGLS